jgi:hypothetical protein
MRALIVDPTGSRRTAELCAISDELHEATLVGWLDGFWVYADQECVHENWLLTGLSRTPSFRFCDPQAGKTIRGASAGFPAFARKLTFSRAGTCWLVGTNAGRGLGKVCAAAKQENLLTNKITRRDSGFSEECRADFYTV